MKTEKEIKRKLERINKKLAEVEQHLKELVKILRK